MSSFGKNARSLEESGDGLKDDEGSEVAAAADEEYIEVSVEDLWVEEEVIEDDNDEVQEGVHAVTEKIESFHDEGSIQQIDESSKQDHSNDGDDSRGSEGSMTLKGEDQVKKKLKDKIERLLPTEAVEEGKDKIERLSPSGVIYESQRPSEGYGERSRMVLLVVCFCCCLLVVAAIVLPLILLGSEDEPTKETSTSKPSPFPTVATRTTTSPSVTPSTILPISPGMESPSPTDPIPEEIFLFAEEDTYIEDGVLADNGEASTLHVGEDIIILISFNISDLPEPADILDRDKTARLQLAQVVESNSTSASANNTPPTNLRISRLPSTSLSIETLTSEIFTNASGDVFGTNFTVAATDDVLQVDITELLFGQPPFVRSTQETQFLLAIESLEAPEDSIVEFWSTESTLPPQLIVGLVRKSASPTVSLEPSSTYVPSLRPSPSLEPSTSINPTIKNILPSVSSSGNESSIPTVSLAPSILSTSPSNSSMLPTDEEESEMTNVAEAFMLLEPLGLTLPSDVMEIWNVVTSSRIQQSIVEQERLSVFFVETTLLQQQVVDQGVVDANATSDLEADSNSNSNNSEGSRQRKRLLQRSLRQQSWQRNLNTADALLIRFQTTFFSGTFEKTALERELVDAFSDPEKVQQYLLDLQASNTFFLFQAIQNATVMLTFEGAMN